jgi:hypothetical protein
MAIGEFGAERIGKRRFVARLEITRCILVVKLRRPETCVLAAARIGAVWLIDNMPV